MLLCTQIDKWVVTCYPTMEVCPLQFTMHIIWAMVTHYILIWVTEFLRNNYVRILYCKESLFLECSYLYQFHGLACTLWLMLRPFEAWLLVYMYREVVMVWGMGNVRMEVQKGNNPEDTRCYNHPVVAITIVQDIWLVADVRNSTSIALN